MSLYPRLLGPSWRLLAEPVRLAHVSGSTVRGHGRLRISHGHNHVVRLLAWSMRLPRSSDAAETRLVITARADGEEWRRTFGPLRDGGGRLPVGPPRSLCGARASVWELALEDRATRRGQEMIARRRLHRVVFVVAGLYNMAWGLWSMSDPQWLFRFAGMPVANQPAVFARLGMVWLIQSGEWPPSAFVLCLTNDLIWWIPFGLYLHDAWPAFRRQ